MEAERRGYGINIPFPELTEDKLSAAIDEILSNSSYKLRAKEHGRLVMDEMTKPLERAVWWMEYAMRYPGKYIINMCSLQQTPYFFHGIFPDFIEQKTKKMRFGSKIKI